MTRQTAYTILTKYLTNPALLKHSLATEAAMRALAPRFNEDVETWGLVGLLHDADYDRAKNNPEKHGILLFRLEPNSIPTVIEHAIKAHNYKFTNVLPESPMDWAITCCDELTNIIIACTQVGKKTTLAELTSDVIIQKLGDKDFAKGADKTALFLCEEKLGIPLPEFVDITLKAMQVIASELESSNTK